MRVRSTVLRITQTQIRYHHASSYARNAPCAGLTVTPRLQLVPKRSESPVITLSGPNCQPRLTAWPFDPGEWVTLGGAGRGPTSSAIAQTIGRSQHD